MYEEFLWTCSGRQRWEKTRMEILASPSSARIKETLSNVVHHLSKKRRDKYWLTYFPSWIRARRIFEQLTTWPSIVFAYHCYWAPQKMMHAGCLESSRDILAPSLFHLSGVPLASLLCGGPSSYLHTYKHMPRKWSEQEQRLGDGILAWYIWGLSIVPYACTHGRIYNWKHAYGIIDMHACTLSYIYRDFCLVGQ